MTLLTIFVLRKNRMKEKERMKKKRENGIFLCMVDKKKGKERKKLRFNYIFCPSSIANV